MIKRVVSIRIRDMLSAMDEIDDILVQRDFAFYQSSIVTRRAVERCLEIVSEASRYIPSELTDRYPAIPWHAVRGIGNLLRHEYQRVEDHVVWRTATASLEELRPILLEMLDAADRADGS